MEAEQGEGEKEATRLAPFVPSTGALSLKKGASFQPLLEEKKQGQVCSLFTDVDTMKSQFMSLHFNLV